MERAKTEYKWRAYSADRAVAELERLASFTDLSHWVVNLADPLFGFKRRWRRQVLEGIIERGLKPRQYWTLTRSDDLDVEDVKLLAAARFSIGIGLESGSPEMLTRMQKGNTPGKYLEAMKRLARLSRAHGLNWASNIIVGHPGETMQSMEETRDFLWSLFTEGRETCGWLSIDPFRLYPGAFVHEQMDAYEKQYGARFYHRRWWASWYDGPFKAQHIDPSHEVDYETRVRFMYDTYQPLVKEVASRFLGQGRSVDKVFARSLEEQVEQLSPKVRDTMLRRAQRARQASENAPVVRMPIGLHVKDERVRNRELAVRRLLERGVVRTERLLEALLRTPLEPFMGDEAARATLRDARATSEVEGDVPRLGISTIAMALEALEPAVGARVGDPTAANGYVAALLAALVTEQGTVVAGTPNGWNAARKLTRALTGYPQIDVVRTDPTVAPARGAFDGLYIGGALPQRPTPLLKALEPTGRLVTVIGPRFATQELVCLTKRADGWDERVVARLKIPVLRGKHGWLRAA